MTEAKSLGGRYELGPVLGRGGMAEVRRARDTRLGREVAVKQLRIDLASDHTFQARFRREAQAAAGLNHPNIVAVYDTGEELDAVSGVQVPYIVMELVDGRTLRDLLRDGRKILPNRALEFTEGVLEALSYSHKAGIVHRDIKPANVMITNEGVVKVMDFGIARAVADTSATMTQTAAIIGTAQYLSPEQARGETVDARSDIYSAGCLLYELLTGRPPFVGDSPVSVAYQHVRENPIPPSKIDALITPSMDAITLKALAKDPAHRYQTASAMRADIAKVLAGQPVSAAVPAAASDSAATQLMQATSASPATRVMSAVTTTSTGRQPGRAVEPAPKKPLDRRIIWGIVAGLAVVGIVVGFLVFNPGKAVQVPVPNVVGLLRADAEAKLRDAKLNPVVTEVGAADDATVGRVTSQDPQSVAGRTVASGSDVKIIVNVGPKKATVPYGLIGKDKATVQAALQAAGFANLDFQLATEEPADAKADQVLKISEAEGAQVRTDTKITITVAVGSARVPNLIGLSRADAQAEANRAGFTNLSWEQRQSTQPAGTVVAQNPTVGQTAKKTDVLTIYYAVAVATPTASATPQPTTSAG